MAMIEPDQIDAAEELNWEKINASEGKKFKQRIDLKQNNYDDLIHNIKDDH